MLRKQQKRLEGMAESGMTDLDRLRRAEDRLEKLRSELATLDGDLRDMAEEMGVRANSRGSLQDNGLSGGTGERLEGSGER